jgi:dTDP-glucose 4,6-dehydratase/UDP-glucuronate decarboxylase
MSNLRADFDDQVLINDIASIAKNVSDELDILQGKKILFTGGAGFLGYEFLHLLAQVGDSDGRAMIDLTIYENFSRGRKPWLDHLSARQNVALEEHDITNPLPCDTPKFDYIIHAASIASPIFYRLNPIETIDANVNGLRYLLDYAKDRAASHEPILGMLFFSTSEIYGDPSPDQIPTSESYRGLVSCTGPRACYDESKRLGETLCVNFAQQYGIPVKIARPFNNYGPGLNINDRRILPDLARDMLSGEDLVLLSDGLATRTFCYITDAISGYVKVLVKGEAGQSYNIGTEEPEISMRELAQTVASLGEEIFDYKGSVVYQESPDKAYLTDNPNRRCPDISKAREQLGYEPQVTISDGMKRALTWYGGNKE